MAAFHERKAAFPRPHRAGRSAPALIALALTSLRIEPAVVNLSSLPAPVETGAGKRVVHGGQEPMADLRSCILRHWIHSHEEDAQGVTVYRSADYNFPPSRGRRGFEFRDTGELIYYGIAPVDGSQQFSGNWVIEGANRIRIEVNSDRIKPFVLDVLSCDEEKLTVKRG